MLVDVVHLLNLEKSKLQEPPLSGFRMWFQLNERCLCGNTRIQNHCFAMYFFQEETSQQNVEKCKELLLATSIVVRRY